MYDYFRTFVPSRMTVLLQCISCACAHATVHASVVHKHTQSACYSLQALQGLAGLQLPQLYDPRPVTAFIV